MRTPSLGGREPAHRGTGVLSFVLPLALAGFLAAAEATAQELPPPRPTVLSIEARGNQRIPSDQILSQSTIRIGAPLEPSAVRALIEKLYRSGQYARVDLSSEPADGGVRLVVYVEENPLVKEILYEGEDKVGEKDLREKVGIKAGGLLSGNELWKAEENLRALYREKGYLLAEVKSSVVVAEPGSAVVTFRIAEGEKVRVKNIVVKGLKHFDSEKIAKQMKTKVDNWHRSGEYKRETYEEDLKKVAAYFRDRGYAEAQVVSDSVWTAENKKDITIEITVEEGPYYQFGTVTATGSKMFTPERIVSAMRIAPGKPYSEKDLEEGIRNAYSLFAEEGYIYANLQPEQTKRDGKIDIVLNVADGPPAHVHRILIAGNRKTKERVIRREMTIFPGDLFRQSAVIRSQREIFQLGYFQDIQLRDENVKGTRDIDLTFEVVEKETGEASLGAGFSSQNGMTGFVKLGESNLFGNGQRANILWEFGGLTQVELSFTEPWLFGSRTTAGADLAVIRRNLDTYYDFRRGGGVRLGRPIPWLDYSRIDWAYRLERREVQPRSGASPAVLAAAGSALSSSMRVTFTRSSTDRPIHPNIGTVTILRGEIAGGPLGGDIQYYQGEIEERWFFPSWWRFVLGLRGRLGVVGGLHSVSEIPIYTRYRLGGTGIYGLRGYGDRDVVPAGNAVDVGGTSMVVFTAEYKFPVVESLYGLFFLDAGNTWNSFREVRLGELKRGAGFGVRFEIPLLGQLGFDLGYGFDDVDSFGRTRRGWEPHFQLGSMF